MRRIFIERARRQMTLWRGAGQGTVELDDEAIEATQSDDQLLAVYEALDKMVQPCPRQAELEKPCYFAGMMIEESAELPWRSQR